MLRRFISAAIAASMLCIPGVSRSEDSNEIQVKLQDRADVALNEVSLSNALQQIAQRYSVDIVVDEPALTEAGVTVETPVDVKVRQVRLATVLDLMLEPLGLAYEVKDRVIRITNPERLAGAPVTRVYSVSDLIQSDQTATTNDQPSPETEAALKRLADVITGTVDPDGWSMHGGNGYLQPHPGTQSLVIRQTAAVHEEIQKLLTDMRAERFATVSSSIYLLDVPAETCTRLGLGTAEGLAVVIEPEDRDEWLRRLGRFDGSGAALPPLSFIQQPETVAGARAQVGSTVHNVMFSSTATRDRRSIRIRIAVTDSFETNDVFSAVQTASVPNGGLAAFLVETSDPANRTHTASRVCVVAPRFVVQEEEEELLGSPAQ